MKNVVALPFDSFKPKFIQEGENYTIKEIAPGTKLIHVNNPLNDLFTLEMRMEVGSRHISLLPYAKRMIDRSGAGEISSNDLKIEWYKLGTDFAFAVRENLSSIVMTGLDENFNNSLKLGRDLIENPNISNETWEETKSIIFSERDDEQKDPSAISNALAHFHRYGPRSRYLERPSDQDLNTTNVKDLGAILQNILRAEKTVLYFGPKSPDEVIKSISQGFIGNTADIKIKSTSLKKKWHKHKSDSNFPLGYSMKIKCLQPNYSMNISEVVWQDLFFRNFERHGLLPIPHGLTTSPRVAPMRRIF
jgi:hypothetical protein